MRPMSWKSFVVQLTELETGLSLGLIESEDILLPTSQDIVTKSIIGIFAGNMIDNINDCHIPNIDEDLSQKADPPLPVASQGLSGHIACVLMRYSKTRCELCSHVHVMSWGIPRRHEPV